VEGTRFQNLALHKTGRNYARQIRHGKEIWELIPTTHLRSRAFFIRSGSSPPFNVA